MTVSTFITTLKPYADELEKNYGIPVELSLAQAALESGWGKKAPGNMYFGVKASNWNGKKQLLTTTEYHDTRDKKYPEIISITPQSNGKYKYVVKDWFRVYDSPRGSFQDYAQILLLPRYKKAFDYARKGTNPGDPYKFIFEVAKAGYSSSPTYADYMYSMINTVKKGLKKNAF